MILQAIAFLRARLTVSEQLQSGRSLSGLRPRPRLETGDFAAGSGILTIRLLRLANDFLGLDIIQPWNP